MIGNVGAEAPLRAHMLFQVLLDHSDENSNSTCDTPQPMSRAGMLNLR